jgi:hypothetical protein
MHPNTEFLELIWVTAFDAAGLAILGLVFDSLMQLEGSAGVFLNVPSRRLTIIVQCAVRETPSMVVIDTASLGSTVPAFGDVPWQHGKTAVIRVFSDYAGDEELLEECHANLSGKPSILSSYGGQILTIAVPVVEEEPMFLRCSA